MIASHSSHRLPATVGGYPILSERGRGGMGIVYLAHDPRLDRRLAIKVLPEDFARDQGQLHRLRREARILASLNHPNIATIYGLIEQDDGKVALILEFVEGEDLAERLRRGPMSVEVGLRVCLQVAEALDVTHERGVIHLDLKPSNVLLSERGLVKLLDFGISRTSRTSGDATRAETQAGGNDSLGSITGTPGYMSPEQGRGESLDHRADIFAFGCLLYECLTGQRAFQGRTVREILDRTLADQPDWSLLPADTPRDIRVLLESCLRKDRDHRPSCIRDVQDSIASVLESRRSASLPPGTPTPVPPNNLPVALTSFVGRGQEIEELLQLVARSSSRLVTLTGPGGCGKTRLALQLADRLLSEHPEGVWVVELSAVNDPARVAGAVAGALNVEEDPGRTEAEGVVAHLRERRLLLLLDNCEHLLQACAELAGSLLLECPELRIVATSRQRLAVAGEQDYPVPSLSGPDVGASAAATAIANADSVRLFVERARAVRPDWLLTDQEAPVVAEICRRLDGIPLAIELAAARIRVLPPKQILARMTDRFRLLAEPDPARAPRQRTLRATLDWSYSLLSREEQRLLCGLSVFAGGWTLEASTAVCGGGLDEFAILDLTTHLVDKSLVVAERGLHQEARFRFLETVREYACEKLAETQDATDLQDRHLAYFLALVEEAAPHLRDQTQAMWFRRLEADHENIHAALDRSMETERGVEKSLRLVGAVWPFWECRGYMRAGLGVTDRVLARDKSTEPSMIQAKARAAAGCLAYGLGDYGAARRHHEEVLSICRKLGDQRGIARALGNLGLVAFNLEDYDAARPLFEECLEIFRRLEDELGIATTLGNLAIVLRNQGDLTGSRKLQEENLRIARKHGNLRGQLISYQNLAVLSYDEGGFDRCRGELHESLRIARELEDRPGVMHALRCASELLHVLKRPVPAVQLRAAVVALRHQMGVEAEPHAQREETQFLKEAREVLDEKQFSRAWDLGSRMSFEEAAALGSECLAKTQVGGDTTQIWPHAAGGAPSAPAGPSAR